MDTNTTTFLWLLFAMICIGTIFNVLLAYWMYRAGINVQFFLGEIKNSSKQTETQAKKIEASVGHFFDYMERRYGQTDELLRQQHMSAVRRYQLAMSDTQPMPRITTVPMPAVRTDPKWVGYPAMVAMQRQTEELRPTRKVFLPHR